MGSTSSRLWGDPGTRFSTSVRRSSDLETCFSTSVGRLWNLLRYVCEEILHHALYRLWGNLLAYLKHLWGSTLRLRLLQIWFRLSHCWVCRLINRWVCCCYYRAMTSGRFICRNKMKQTTQHTARQIQNLHTWALTPIARPSRHVVYHWRHINENWHEWLS